MTHCEKCIHYEMCKWHENLIADTIVTFFPHNEDCSLFKNKADFVETEKVRVKIICKKSETFEYWEKELKQFRATKGYSYIEHDVHNLLRGYSEAVEDMLAILGGELKNDKE